MNPKGSALLAACAVCGREVKANRTSNGGKTKRVCCSTACGHVYRFRRNTAQCLSVLAARRESQSALAALRKEETAVATVKTSACQGCGAVMLLRGRSACSSECRAAVVKRRVEAARAAKMAAKPKPASAACRVCGAVMIMRTSASVFCGKTCARVWARSGRKHRQRAKRRGLAYEPIQSLVVFARDNWRCQICGAMTLRSLRGTNADRAPSIDHVVPLAAPSSPGHVMSNVQTACRKCNSQKGSRYQPRLELSA